MLVFSARIPLKETTTRDDFLDVCIRWVVGSPRYVTEGLIYNALNQEDYDYSNDNITFSIRNYKDQKVEISACRLENREPNVIWTNDCIFLSEENSKSVLIQLNCTRKDFNTKLPVIHKPYIVRMFAESELCGVDNGISIGDIPIKVSEKNYDICVGIMEGTYSYSMPVVYITRDYWGKNAVSPLYLAQQLSGMAHVIDEETPKFTQRLRIDTNGNNVYGGYVGLYFPDSAYCRKFGADYYSDPKDMLRDIVDSVWKSLINRLDSANYNWNQILVLQAKQKINKIDAKSKEELDSYVATFDQENSQLREKITELNEELDNLVAERDRLREQFYAIKAKAAGEGFFRRGKEQELYLNEANDLLYSILSQVKIKYPENSRASTLIKSMLEANPRAGACEEIIKLVQEALTSNGGKLNKTAKAKLIEAGFSIEEGGSHYKIVFHDSRYMFTVAKTPSEYREGKNLLSNIRNVVDVERKI